MKRRRVSVPVATIWTNPESVRTIDVAVVNDRPDMAAWLRSMTRDETIALCKEKRLQTQVLFGNELIIDEIKGAWAKVHVPSQPSTKDKRGYPGWMPIRHSIETDMSTNCALVMVQSKMATFFTTQKEPVFDLSFGTFLPVLETGDIDLMVDSPIGPGFIHKKDVLLPEQQHLLSGSEIVRNAERFLNLPYLWSGMSAYGYDCSGFSYSMFYAGGYLIPRDADDQSILGKAVSFENVLPGDLLFFAYERGKGYVHHVGIYVGNGKMIHSPTPGAIISITELKESKYEEELCTIRRYWKE
ncbi:C40 family peptidase [Sporolactobacillus sp. STSJ-5]|uniref:C40 family peptidase n=1 Tax=Sporolactobacillus sp. STSJ-5 TaxID=2965076 RepID=UPI00272C5F86|nr:C40 family peptidase [Sporolactobacillus sp. STSJ-5]